MRKWTRVVFLAAQKTVSYCACFTKYVRTYGVAVWLMLYIVRGTCVRILLLPSFFSASADRIGFSGRIGRCLDRVSVSFLMARVPRALHGLLPQNNPRDIQRDTQR